MTRRVAITGLGLVSPQGETPEQAFDAWCQGHSAITLCEVGEAPHVAAVPMARCAGFDPVPLLGRPRSMAMDRVSQMSTVAALQAWACAGLDGLSAGAREQAGVFWGTACGGSHTTERSYRDLFIQQRSRISPLTVTQAMHNAAASHVAMTLGLGAVCLSYAVACASSAVAIGEAWRRIRSGEVDLAVAGGGEASVPYGPLKAWQSLQVLAPVGEPPAHACKPFDARRRGLVFGEGAAALVLEDWDHARVRGVPILAELASEGSSSDHQHLTAPDAAGQVRALRQALQRAGLRPQDIDCINAHGTATLEGDATEVRSLREVLGDAAAGVRISSTKSMHGHLLGAAGAMEALATVLTLVQQRVPPTAGLSELDPACAGLHHVQGSAQAGRVRAALSNSFAFGGSNVVLAFKAAA